MKKILYATSSTKQNDFSNAYYNALKSNFQIISSLDVFWNSNFDFDFIHIQWMEELIGWLHFNEKKFEELKERLKYWKSKNTKIIITYNNEKPHCYDAPEFYDYFLNQVDGIIHLGENSEVYLKKEYPNAKHTVIEHPNYLPYFNVNAKLQDARSQLILPQDKKIYTVVGKIRNNEEQEFIIKSFSEAKLPNSVLWLTSPIFSNPFVAKDKNKIDYYKHKWEKLKLKLKYPNINFSSIRSDNNKLEKIITASNFCIIPRLDTLNSGVLYLALSFGKKVIGPNIGNIGVNLKRYNQAVFDPNHHQTLVKVLKSENDVVNKEDYDNFLNRTDSKNFSNQLKEFYDSL